MKTFFMHLLDNKKLILLSVSIMLLLSYLFGFFWYSHTNETIKSFFNHLFYLSDSNYQNNYYLYLMQNGCFIILSTYLSTSFIGYFGSMALIFLKGIQLAYSFMYVFSEINISFILVFLIFIEVSLELIYIYIISYMTINFSIYNLLITFYIKENFQYKLIINFILNYLIVCLVMLCVLLMFRIYLVPLV